MDIETVWQELIEKLKSYPNLNASQIEAIFSRVRIQAVSQGFIMFTTETAFLKDWIETHYMRDIHQALLDLYSEDFMIMIEVDSTASVRDNPNEESVATHLNKEINVIGPQQPFQSQQTQSPVPKAAMNQNEAHGNPEKPQVIQDQHTLTNSVSTPNDIPRQGAQSLTFDTFVIGNSNRFAYTMAVEVADKPGKTDLNPLFIYGRSGVGKTHLLCAIKNYINEQYPQYNVIYMDAMELVNRYSDAAIEKSVDKLSFKNFESFFKQADVLLLDDVQSLQGKSETLNVFFRIFNDLISQGKQVVLSADRSPNNIDLDKRYTSRFNSGGTADIQPPDNETKLNIVRRFIKQYENEEGFKFELSDGVLDYIVESSSSNIRELKSAMITVFFAAKLDPTHVLNRQDVKTLLSNHFMSESNNALDIDLIQAAVEDFYSISHSDLVGSKRNRTLAHPRHVAIYLCRELLGSTFKAIAQAFNRNYTTIMHSYDLIEKNLNEDVNLREEIEAIREKIRIQQY